MGGKVFTARIFLSLPLPVGHQSLLRLSYVPLSSSSLASITGRAAGVIDADYRGELGVIMFNFSDIDYEG